VALLGVVAAVGRYQSYERTAASAKAAAPPVQTDEATVEVGTNAAPYLATAVASVRTPAVAVGERAAAVTISAAVPKKKFMVLAVFRLVAPSY
jgi:hypothetical protein